MNLIQEFLREYIPFLRLREEKRDRKRIHDYSVDVILSKKEIEDSKKWEKYDTDVESQKQIFFAARDGDESAVNYILRKLQKTIINAFKATFLQFNPEARQDKESSWITYAGIAKILLTKGMGLNYRNESLLKRFKYSEYNPDNTKDLFKPFYRAMYIWLKYQSELINKAEIRQKKIGGGVDSLSGYGENENSERDIASTIDTVDEAQKNIKHEEILTKWKRLIRRPDLNEKIGNFSSIQILRILLETRTKKISDLVSLLGIDRNEAKDYIKRITSAMDIFQITMKDLDQLNQEEISLLNQYTGDLPSSVIETFNPATFLDQWNEFVHEPHLYVATAETKYGGWSSGPILFTFLEEPGLTPQELSDRLGPPLRKEKRLSPEYFRDQLRQAYKWASHYNLTKKDIDKGVAMYGAQTLIDLAPISFQDSDHLHPIVDRSKVSPSLRGNHM